MVYAKKSRSKKEKQFPFCLKYISIYMHQRKNHLYMSRASPVSRAEFSHENIFMTVTDNFNELISLQQN